MHGHIYMELNLNLHKKCNHKLGEKCENWEEGQGNRQENRMGHPRDKEHSKQ